MKNLLLFFSLMLSSNTFAETQFCQGRELIGGGASGKVEMDLEQLQVRWTPNGGQSIPWATKTAVCGVPVQIADCEIKDLSQAYNVGYKVSCMNPETHKNTAVFTIVANKVNHGGRMTCQTEPFPHIIQISNCRSEP